jgi:hypothetical protein
MEAASAALLTTPCSPRRAGSKPGSWRSELLFSARKPCLHCGGDFTPWIKRDAAGAVLSFMKPGLWAKQRFCGKSCSKKHENPMLADASRLKMVATLRSIGHKPPVRMGNGTGLTRPQGLVLAGLGEGWEAEVAIATGAERSAGDPKCFKIDVANRELMIGIEVDGNSHGLRSRQEQDRRKDAFLMCLGWRVYRVKNAEAEHLCSTCKSPATLLTSLMGS